MRIHLSLPLYLLLLTASATQVLAQPRKFVIAVIGSSTAQGVGASPIDSSWVNRTKAYFKKLRKIDTIYNIALGGQTSYAGMPTDFVPPPNRPAPDTATNVTKALSFHPDVVLVSFPTNDAAADFTLAETMSNLRAIFQQVRAEGKVCYIATSQPRNSIATVQQALLKTMRDSVLREFAPFCLNFYNPIVAADSVSINPIYNFDGTHVNDAGHRQLFQVVQHANILAGVVPLSLTLIDLRAVPAGRSVVLNWIVTNQTSPLSFVVQRSPDGSTFDNIWQDPDSTFGADPPTSPASTAAGYWTDNKPLPGKSYYRLKYSTEIETAYSSIVGVDLTAGKFGIGKLIAAAATDIQAEILSPSQKTCTISVLNTAGQLVYRQVIALNPPGVMITIPASGWVAGEYFLHLVTDQGDVATQAFLKF